MGKKQKEESKTQRSSLIPDSDGILAETIFDPKTEPQVRFAVYRNGKSEVETSAIVNGKEIYPPSDPFCFAARGTVLLPCRPTPYGNQEKLVRDIVQFVHRYADVPEFWEEIMAHYVLMTWVYDRFSALPYLRFLGEPGTGKSRLLQTVGHLCYKAIIVGAGMTASPMFRLLDLWRGTFVVDEAELNSEAVSDIIRIFNAGYMRGCPVIRSEAVGASFEPRAFEVFGPKIIANRNRFPDAGLESRCLTFQTIERTLRKNILRQLPNSFNSEAGGLRNKLLQWRFDNHVKVQTDDSAVEGLGNRRGQIAIPMLAVSRDHVFRKSLLAFLKEQETEERAERPQTVVARAILELSQGQPTVLLVKAVAEKASELSNRLGLGVPLTPKSAGHLVRSIGLEPKHSRDGAKFSVDKKKLVDLAERYRIE